MAETQRKYTTKVKQAQYVGNVEISPNGGNITEAQKEEIINDPYGKELIRKNYLVIDGVKPEDIDKPPVKPSAKEEAPALPAANEEIPDFGGSNEGDKESPKG